MYSVAEGKTVHHKIGYFAYPKKIKFFITLEKWKGELEQLDDVCVIGVKI